MPGDRWCVTAVNWLRAYDYTTDQGALALNDYRVDIPLDDALQDAAVALDRFIDHRLPTFGRYEDAMLAADPWLSHSVLSASMNLGLVDPVELMQQDVVSDTRPPEDAG